MEPQLFSCGLRQNSKSSGLRPHSPSMEPQLFSCGLLIAKNSITKKQSPSMEPQLFSCGLGDKLYQFRGNNPPSMEPQLFSCGLKEPVTIWVNLNNLQWSRNFSVADWRSFPVTKRGANSLQWSRNFSVADCSGCYRQGSQHIHLQWSRNFSVADCSGMPWRSIPRPVLQWSRNFSVADCMTHHSQNHAILFPSMEPQLFSCGLGDDGSRRLSISSAFNGAATFQLRIDHCYSYAYDHGLCLQWSRNFSVADCGKHYLFVWDHLQPSMEPQLFSCGLKYYVFYSMKGDLPFNGAATFQLRIVQKLFYRMMNLYLQWSRNFSVADCRYIDWWS